MAPSGTHLQRRCGGWTGHLRYYLYPQHEPGGHKATKDSMGEALVSVSKAAKGKSKGQQKEKGKKTTKDHN